MKNRHPPKKPRAFAPVPRKQRRDGWAPERQKAFIDSLCASGSVSRAAAAVRMSAESAYRLRRQAGAEEFAAAWDGALDHAIAVLRDAVMERAIHGVEEPVVSCGKRLGTRRVFNDRIATFMLRNYDGKLSGGAIGPRLHQRRMIEAAVAEARAQWEAERERPLSPTELFAREQIELVRQRLAPQWMLQNKERE